jgi:uncharacterized membrane protein YvbJ
MFCSKCGSQIQDTSKFCPSCGQEVGQAIFKSAPSSKPATQSSQSEDSPMSRAVTIFIPTFLVIFVINQMFYGGCFKGYCLAAAFPQVTVMSALLTWFFFSLTKDGS